MAAVRVPREKVESDALPAVCVKTGEPADQEIRATFSWLPPWTYLLLLAGIFPFLIALFFANEKITARLPVRTYVVDRHRQLTRRVWLLLGLAVGLGVLVGLVGEEWLWLGPPAAVVGAVGTLMRRAQGWIDIRPLRGTSQVELRRVSPAFVTALHHDPELQWSGGR
jgi:hypothetical protein